MLHAFKIEMIDAEAHFMYYSKPQFGLGAPYIKLRENSFTPYSFVPPMPLNEPEKAQETIKQSDQSNSENNNVVAPTEEVQVESTRVYEEDEDGDKKLLVMDTLVKRVISDNIGKLKRKIGQREEGKRKRLRLATQESMPALMKNLADQLSFFKEVVDHWEMDDNISVIMSKVEKYKEEGMLLKDAMKLALKKRKPKFTRLLKDGVKELFLVGREDRTSMPKEVVVEKENLDDAKDAEDSTNDEEEVSDDKDSDEESDN